MEVLQVHRATSVQDYLDETPQWADGTAVAWTPLTAMQWRTWALAAAGWFFEGLVVFMTGAVAAAFLLPVLMVNIGMTAVLIALAATSLAGAAVTYLFRIETKGARLDKVDA